MTDDLALGILGEVLEAFPEGSLDRGRRILQVPRCGFEVTITAEDAPDGGVLLRHEFPVLRYLSEPAFFHHAVLSAEGSMRDMSAFMLEDQIVSNRVAFPATVSSRELVADLLIYATLVEPVRTAERVPSYTAVPADVAPAECIVTIPDDAELRAEKQQARSRLDETFPAAEHDGWDTEALESALRVFGEAGIDAEIDGAGLTAEVLVDPDIVQVMGPDHEPGYLRFRCQAAVRPNGIPEFLWLLELPSFPKDGRRGDIFPTKLNVMEWEIPGRALIGSWAIEPFNAEAIPYFRVAAPMRFPAEVLIPWLTAQVVERAGWIRQYVAPSPGLDELFDHLGRGPGG